MDKFEGIQQYHDGLAVSDYCNMIPLGDLCLDRVGDKEITEPVGSGFSIRGVFVDSLHNIYIAYGDLLFRFAYDKYTDSLLNTNPETMTMMVDGEQQAFRFKNKVSKITFCESSIKPSIVFCCDGELIYGWATVNDSAAFDQGTDSTYGKFQVNVIAPPGVSPKGDTVDSDETVVETIYDDSIAQPDFNSFYYGKNTSQISKTNMTKYAKSISSICWYDNRLVAVEQNKNTVWLTKTDPMDYWRNKSRNYLDASNDDTGGIVLWENWYSSTANTDKLNTAISYNGQLYFFNEHTIEIWSRTGNEDNPIQSNTVQQIHYGGSSPIIIEGVLYFIGNDSMNDHFIGAFSPQFTKVSNKEIETRINKIETLLPIHQYHKTYLFVKTDKDSYVFGDQGWWRWKTPTNASYSVYCSIIRDYAISSDARIIKFDYESRLSGGKKIERSIRDGFQLFQNRQIFRVIELVADTGRTADREQGEDDIESHRIYCQISANRGMWFSQRRYRTLGQYGHNNKVIEWRNLGSGNSFLFEVGTSSLHKLQIYNISPKFA